MVEGEVSLNLTFSVAEDEYYFYIPQSFRITGTVMTDEYSDSKSCFCSI